MARKGKYELKDRKDFWNVPCNPIIGARLTTQMLSEPKKVQQLFFSESPLFNNYS